MSTLIKLEEIDWSNPLKELRKKLIEKSPEEERYSIDSAFDDCLMYFNFLSNIWLRIHKDLEDYHSCIEINMKYVEGGSWTTMTEEEKAVLNDRGKCWIYLPIDFESFIIFSRIYTDKVIGLTRFFLKGKELPSSFHKHIDFFKKHTSFESDEEYAEYIRENTNCFERLLFIPRDKLIVHSPVFRRLIIGLTSGQVTYIKGRYWIKDFKVLHDQLKSLKEKYKDKYPEFQNADDSFYRLVELFSKPRYEFELEDQRKLESIMHTAGGGISIEHLNELAKRIIEFSEFINNHFGKKLEGRQGILKPKHI